MTIKGEWYIFSKTNRTIKDAAEVYNTTTKEYFFIPYGTDVYDAINKWAGERTTMEIVNAKRIDEKDVPKKEIKAAIKRKKEEVLYMAKRLREERHLLNQFENLIK